MSDIVSPLLQWLNANPQLAGLVTFIISAGESIAIIGTIVPGSIMMTALGALAGAGVIPLWETIFWAIIGAIVGDGISYWIGHYFQARLPKLWPFSRYPNILKTGEVFVHKYGSMSVFIGRFVGPVRALVPLVAGMLGMKPLQFVIANVTSAIGWAPAYMLPGILLGAASLELPPDIAVHVMLVLLLIGLFILMCLWFAYKLAQLFNYQTTQLQNEFWQWLQTSRYFPLGSALFKHYDKNKRHGQLNLAIYFLVTSILFITLVIYTKIAGPANIVVNDALFHLFRGIRTNGADNLMLNITLLGQKQVILPVVIALCAWLIFSKRWRAALHALALIILGTGGIFVVKHIVRTERPWGILASPETYSMPSGHATLSALLFMGLAFLIANAFRPERRSPIYAIGLLITLAVGISRLYLGAHWFTDILAAWLLSAAILIFVIISYQRRKEKPVNPVGILLVSLLTLVISFSIFHARQFDRLTVAYSQMGWPTLELSMNDWWQKNDALPAYRASLFGFPSQQINIEWAGNLQDIGESLLREGWSVPPARDYVTILHRIADIKSAQYLSLVSPQYLDKNPSLILVRQASTLKGLLVLRLWDANRTITDTQSKLWVGIVGTVPRSYSWLFKSRPGDIDIDPALVFPTKNGLVPWQWKIMLMNLASDTNQLISQKIMLIRENKIIHKKL